MIVRGRGPWALLCVALLASRVWVVLAQNATAAPNTTAPAATSAATTAPAATSAPAAPVSTAVTISDRCICDLTDRACDVNCFCDTDCALTDEQKATLFPDPLAEGTAFPSIEYCVDDASVHSVNLPSSSSIITISKTLASDGFLDRLLCVVDTNNPALGRFFLDPGAASESDLSTSRSAVGESTWNPVTASGGLATSYVAGSAVPAAYSDGTTGTLRFSAGNVFAVPEPGLSGECLALRPVGFGVNFPRLDGVQDRDLTCVNRVTAATCTDASSLFRAARYDLLMLGSTAAASTFVRATFANLGSVDLATGAFTAATGAAATTAPAPAVAGSTCTGVVVAANVTVTYDLPGQAISAVTAEVVTADVALDTVAPFEVQVTWRQASEITAGARRTSGTRNVGYVEGLPLRASTLTPSDATLSALTELELPQAGADGQCTAGGFRATASFASDLASSCAQQYTLAELRTFCQSGALPLTLQLLNGIFAPASGSANLTFSGRDIFIGIYGDSDPSVAADWVQVSVESVSDLTPMTWSESDLTCSNVVTGLDVEVLTAQIGQIDNPQRVAQLARARFITGAWRWPDGLADAAASKPFVLTNSVTFFAREQGDPVERAKKRPSFLPRLPSDAFYPFLEESAGGAAALSAGAAAASALAAAALLLL
ncbi:unnamed protein product [Pedinophyceae sp. YPF-701]|nr:unnamed protein product [Pedinophyceae sp. YPF-701]